MTIGPCADWVARLTIGGGRCAQFKPNMEIFTQYRPAYMSAVVGVAQFESQFVREV